MTHSDTSHKRTPISMLFEYSLFLVLGAVGALAWANADKMFGTSTHQNLFETDLAVLVTGDKAGGHDGGAHHGEQAGHAGEHDDDHEGQAHSDDGHSDGGHSDDGQSDDGHSDDGDEEGQAGSASAAGHSTDSESSSSDGEEASGATAAAEEGHDDSHHHAFNLHFVINDILMALFFAIAGKEVWESLLPGGALSNPKKAATPLLATLGGIVGPAGIYVLGALALNEWSSVGNGWAIPCATDIAFSYLVARLIFGNGHPAIAFLLLLAIADDAAGLMIIALFYSDNIEPIWLLLTVGAMATAFVFHKQLRLQSFWWYLLIPGVLSWFSFYQAGIHSALGLVPIIPFMPHAHSDLGIFAREEHNRTDTLNAFEHWWKNPVEIILGLFGLCNAGVAFSSVGTATWLVLAGLLIGKPVGITLFTLLAEKGFKLEVPKGMGYREIVTLGFVAAIGFTVALFVSGVAFSVADGPVLDAAKMGALASFGAALIAIAVAKALGVRTWEAEHPDSKLTPEQDQTDQVEASDDAPSPTSESPAIVSDELGEPATRP